MDQQVQDQTVVTADHDTESAERTNLYVKTARWIKQHLVFVITVAVPTLVATSYYSIIASDVYTSESRFLVRSPQQRVQTGLVSELLQDTGLSHSQDDTYSVHDFILSRDALRELDEQLGIRKAYSSPGIDWFDRFGSLSWEKSFEAFYKYYGKHVVTVDYDSTSSITVLTVRAFTARDAAKINQMLLDMSERLVNSLNDRSRRDLVEFAEHEVDTAAAKAQEASLAMLQFRSKRAVFEPDQQAAIQLEGVAKLQEALISTEAELAQVRKLSPSNPQIAGLETRAETLRKATAAEASKVTDGTGSFSANAPAFERLELVSEFADKRLGQALAELAEARSEAARKQLYLDRLVQPNLPDEALQPRRVRNTFAVFMVGLIVWGAASLVLAAIREHAD